MLPFASHSDEPPVANESLLFGAQSPFKTSFGKIIRAFHARVHFYSSLRSSYGELTLDFGSWDASALTLVGHLMRCLPFELAVPEATLLPDTSSHLRLIRSISTSSYIPHSVCIAVLRICPNLKAVVTLWLTSTPSSTSEMSQRTVFCTASIVWHTNNWCSFGWLLYGIGFTAIAGYSI